MVTTRDRKIQKDSRGLYVRVNGKRIRFKDGIIKTPVKISKNKEIGDYRAFGGVKAGEIVTLAIYDR